MCFQTLASNKSCPLSLVLGVDEELLLLADVVDDCEEGGRSSSASAALLFLDGVQGADEEGVENKDSLGRRLYKPSFERKSYPQ